MSGRIVIEELGLSIGAYNVLKSQDINFIEDIQPFLDRALHPLSSRNVNLIRYEKEIRDKLRRWEGDSSAGAAVGP